MSETHDITWGDEPGAVPRSDNRGRWPAFAAALKERPGEWGSVELSTSNTYQTRRRFTIGEMGEGFEAVTRPVAGDPRRRRLYVRFVGKPNLKATAS